MRIGLIPLDERPVNTRYPAMIARIADAEVVEPPWLSNLRQPADCDQIAAWLTEQAPTLDALVVSMQMLGYGGLIASRTTTDSVAQVINRLDVLRAIKRQQPQLTIYGFDLITRISNADYNVEEPLYWDTYGTRIYAYSQLLDQEAQGQPVRGDIEKLESEIPPEHLRDFMARRLRNHTVNLAVFELLTSGVLDLLVLSSDDTSEFGLGTREKRWLTEWASRLSVGDRLLMYPGADEVGCALVARVLNQGTEPRFFVHYSITGDEEITAPFEDGPVRITVERQVRAVGGVLVTDPTEADFIVAVNTPAPSGKGIFEPALRESESAYRAPHLPAFVQKIKAWVDADRRVILTDVAYPNGADPVLIDLLRDQLGADLTKLAAYGGWNTAGNTIGTAFAEGVAVSFAQDEQAAEQFLLHRFVEDWAYMHITRQELATWLGTSSVAPDKFAGAQALIESGLQAGIEQLPGFAGQWRIVLGSIRLPWNRTFEVDFDLERT